MEIKRYGKNEKGRDFVCSDLHGMLDKFYAAYDRVKFDPSKDRMFCCGDLIDRGSDSERCLKLVEKDWFFATRGNHEDMLLMGATQAYGQRYHSNHGGEWFYSLKKDKRERYAALVEAMPYAIEVETDAGLIGIVHADVCVPWQYIREALDGTNPDAGPSCKTSIAWGDSRFKNKDQTPVEGVHHVYVGHIPLKNGVLTLGNVSYIDGGACYGQSRTVHLVQFA